MKPKALILFFVIALTWTNSYAGNPKLVRQFINHTDWSFVENKGQLPDAQIRYSGHQGGIYLYCKPGKISFVFTKVEKETNDQISESLGRRESPFTKGALVPTYSGGGFDPSKSKMSELTKTTINRTDFVLLNSNPSATILASDQQEYYENYYTQGNADSGITNVHTFKTITYKNIYPYIDMVLMAKPNGMKYEFVVYPGGKVSDIQMQWGGIESIKKLKDSKIEYSCALGKMEESQPVSFQGVNCVESDFIRNGSMIAFNIGDFDKTEPLIIDPMLIWGTYFGGSGGDGAGTVVLDSSGNVYIGGETESTNDIATLGAYQTSYAGTNNSLYGGDVFIAKFSNKGLRLWATYYGGPSIDNFSGLATDNSGNIYVTGSTVSTSGIASSGSYQTNLKGNEDAFLAKFNSNGKRQWATYFGGDEQNESYGIAIDANSDLFIAGETTSLSDIATQGAYQTSLSGSSIMFGGQSDGFLAKFSNSGSLIWATYYGGRAGDYATSVATDKSGNVFITGITESDTGIATKGSYQSSYAGGVDAFLAKFSTSGLLVWSTYYGGYEYEYATCVTADKSGNIFISGATESSQGIATSGTYQTDYMSPNITRATDGYLAKFTSAGQIKWATYYGGEENSGDEMFAVTTDENENVYAIGETVSTYGIASCGTYQTSFNPVPLTISQPIEENPDAFLVKFNSIGIREWATYFGDSLGTWVSGVAADDSGYVYMVGGTISNTGIATKGAYQTSFAGPSMGNGPYGDAFIAKFYGSLITDAGVISVISPLANACPGKQVVKVRVKNFGNYNIGCLTIQCFISGNTIFNYDWGGTLFPDSSIVLTIGSATLPPGKFTLKAWTTNPNQVADSIPSNDTSIVALYIHLPEAITGPSQTICSDSNITIGDLAVPGDEYSWTSKPLGFNSTVSNPTIKPLKTTTYYLTEIVINGGCSKTDSVLITVNPRPPDIFIKSSSICIGDSISLVDSNYNSYNIFYATSQGTNSFPANPVVKPTFTTEYYLRLINKNTGCETFDSVIITVNSLPIPNSSPSTYNICIGTHIKIGANAKPNYIYAWSSTPSGFSSSLADPVVDPLNNTVYSLSITDTTTGCTNKNSTNVFVGIAHAPVIDVGKNQAVCAGFSAQIGSDSLAGDSYSWVSNPIGFVSSKAKLIVTPVQTTSYLLTVTSSIGCTNFDSVTITVNPLPSPKTGASQNICEGTAVQLGIAPINGHVYSWTSNPTGFSSTLSNPVDTPKTTTKYDLKETNKATGCADSDSVIIYVVPKPVVGFISKNINGYEYQFTVQNPNYRPWEYRWDFGDSTNYLNDTASGYSVTHTYPRNGKYIITLTADIQGFCTVISTDTIVINLNFSLKIYPNAFSLQTNINYTLANPAHIRISVTDAIGRQIGVLKDAQLAPGEYNTEYSGASWKTRPGVYFVLFEIDGTLYVRKIIQVESIYY